MAQTAAGLCQVVAGRPKAGIRMLERTLEICDPHPPITADCLRALIKAHQQAGDRDMARYYLQRLQDLTGAPREAQRATDRAGAH